jgi:hypothetical protein
MEAEYHRIERRATEDSGTAGDEGEENWRKLFVEWLPPAYQVVTKGRILGHEGETSPQVDVLVLKPTYPKALLNKKKYLAAGVAAAFECKLTLKAEHIRDAIATAAKIRRLVPARVSSAYQELFSPITYGLLAHSHSWRGAQSDPVRAIKSQLYAWQQNGAVHPRELIDVICVSDLGTFPVVKAISNRGRMNAPVLSTGYLEMIPAHVRAKYERYTDGNFIECQEEKLHRPIGSLLCCLLARLGWENRDLRDLAEYFDLANLPGSGAGQHKEWPVTALSSDLRDLLQSRPTSQSNYPWGEWNEFFVL